ncbi:MAG: PH domain-containing protein [Candidatus Marinimicrobia bacterium]|nr:PH domain-containing protein [Candidatus Neomarinimicrobiota bacterium]
MNITPDPKLITKQWYILLTITCSAIISAGIILLLIRIVEGILPQTTLLIIGFITLGLIILMWIITVPLVLLWIRNLSYRIEEDRITIFKGILTKVQQNIPYRAVTDFALKRTLFDRMLGIGSICIQTAGQTQNPSGYEGKLAGLTDFDRLHHELRNKLKQLHPVGEAITTAEPVRADDASLLSQILIELQKIRKSIENA